MSETRSWSWWSARIFAGLGVLVLVWEVITVFLPGMPTLSRLALRVADHWTGVIIVGPSVLCFIAGHIWWPQRRLEDRHRQAIVVAQLHLRDALLATGGDAWAKMRVFAQAALQELRKVVW